MPMGQVNLHSATREELFERLAWFYATVNQITLFDADGYQHKNSNLIYLLRGRIPIPTRFALRYNFEQKASYIRSLTVRDICCTYGDWVNHERLPESMSDQSNSRGQQPFLSMEGLQLRNKLFEFSSLLNQLKKFPIHLLDTWNSRIWQILESFIWIIATSNKQNIMSFIPTSTSGNCSTKCASLPER